MNQRLVCGGRRSVLVWPIYWSVALAAAGCSSTAPGVRGGQGSEAWSGRFHLKTQAERPHSVTAIFTLEGSAKHGQLMLWSPIGTALAQATWGDDYARLVVSDQTTHFANMDELTTTLMGSAIPVWALFDWLQGRPTAVDGWEVGLERLTAGRIEARRHHPLPVTEVRILIDSPEPP